MVGLLGVDLEDVGWEMDGPNEAHAWFSYLKREFKSRF